MFTKQRIDEILAMREKATKGPWCFVEPKRNDGEGYSIYQTPGNYGQAITGWGQVTQTKENAEYIVAACNTFPELAQRVLELEAEVNRLQEIESFAEDVCEELEGHGLYAISRLTDVLTTPRGEQVELNKQTNKIANLESQLAEAQKQNKKLMAVVEVAKKMRDKHCSDCHHNSLYCHICALNPIILSLAALEKGK